MAAVSLLDLDGGFQRVEVQGICERGDAGADQVAGLRVHLHQIDVRDLLNADEYIQHGSLLPSHALKAASQTLPGLRMQSGSKTFLISPMRPNTSSPTDSLR